MEENLDKRVTVETLYGFLKERLSLTPLAVLFFFCLDVIIIILILVFVFFIGFG